MRVLLSIMTLAFMTPVLTFAALVLWHYAGLPTDIGTMIEIMKWTIRLVFVGYAAGVAALLLWLYRMLPHAKH